MFYKPLVLLLALMGAAAPLFAKSSTAEHLGSPLVFEPNRGQAPSTVRFLARGNGHSLLLKDREAVLSFANPAVTVRMKLVGQNPEPQIQGTGLKKGVTNYFHGNDPSQWLNSVPQFEKVRYSKVYPGIDLVYYGSGRQFEYDFELQPFINPATIQIEFEGVSGVSVSPEGDLVLATPSGEIRHRRPVAFQRRGNLSVPVEASFILRDARVGFEIGRYDRGLPLTIDPKLEWSSFLGGTGNDQGNDIIIDDAGSAYIGGFTQTVAMDEPPPATLQTPTSKGFEAFITKLDSIGAVVYNTYFGGTPLLGSNPLTVDDEAHSLAFDGSGSIYVAGYTFSQDFPIVNGFQTTLRGVQDAYLAKLDAATGTLQFSSYLGGNQSDRAYGVAVDSAGNAYLAGSTLSTNFPVVNAFQPIFGTGLRDAFLTKVTVAGTIGFSTYLGGFGDEQAYDVAVDSDGEITLTGYTSSVNFPTTRALFGTYRGGIDDMFITKFNSSGTGLVFSTFWGGNDSDNGVRLAVDSDNKIYITGLTSSGLDFPLKAPAQLFNAGRHDAFLIKMHPDGQDADFSTFIGAEDTEGGTSIAVDSGGFIYVAGFTNSLSFFAINAVNAFLRGERDGFVIKISSDASQILYSTYLGGFGAEGITGIAVDASRNAYVTGFTTSIALGFPLVSDPFQGENAGLQDAFVMKIVADDIKSNMPYTFPFNGGTQTSTAGLTAQPTFGYAAVDVQSGPSPTGLAILDLRSSGVLLNEVSLPLSQLADVGRVYVTTSVSAATALTLANPHDEEVRVDVYFTANGQGTNVFRNFNIPAHAQISAFTYALPYAFPQEQVGTLTYTATLPIAAVALRSGATGGSANVYLPIINPYSANPDPVTIPQFADGGGWSGQVYLVNPTEDVITGEIRFFKSGLPGEPGLPLELATDKGTASVFSYAIDPRQSFSMVTFGSPTTIVPGFVDIVPTSGSNTPLAHAVLHFTESSFLATTVEAVKAANEFKMYAELTGTFREPLGTMPALSLANSLDTPATVTLRLIGLDGVDTGLSAVITLPPKGHLARFLYEIPGFENPPASFRGLLRATTSQPGVTFAGFRTRYNELGEFMITATGPLKDTGTNLPILFPHLVDGGGYATQLILINGTSGGAGTGTIRILDQGGGPLNVAILPE